jgi:crotonobetainyl-CoA:carnitine CoA-transferase CaiB-like acyl-CoA transferase
MGFLGADVVRIENPSGDAFYDNPPRMNGIGASYINANLHKRNVQLDLKSDEGKRIGQALGRWADVLIENRLGVLEKLGLGYEELSEENPGLVYVSSPGFGSKGPYAGRPALDSYIQAFSGFASTQGLEGGEPEFFRVFGYLDHAASTFMVQAAILGLIERRKTGRGVHIEASHLASSVFLQLTRIAEYFETGQEPPRLGSAATTFAPSQAFRCLDGNFITISAPDNDCWAGVTDALDLSELAGDPRFVSSAGRLAHRSELAEAIQKRTTEGPAWLWLGLLRRHGVACEVLKGPEEVIRDPDLREHCLVSVASPWGNIWHADNPWEFSETPAPEVGAARAPGADNAEIESMLGERQV